MIFPPEFFAALALCSLFFGGCLTLVYLLERRHPSSKEHLLAKQKLKKRPHKWAKVARRMR